MMTEAEWLQCNDPANMLHAVQHSSPSERKVRLFNAAVCRRFWQHLPEESQAVLAESELVADGLAQIVLGENDLCWRANAVVAPFDRQFPAKNYPSEDVRMQRDSAAAVCYAVIPHELWGAVSYFWEIDPSERRSHSVIIRDIFGNPFRPVTFDPPWRTLSVVSLAQTIYDERSFGKMPDLGDALERAGCRDDTILDHCRKPGEHVRGCWVVDLALGKS
jgi:hypothetical protein